jgi:hypothetical protein
MTGCFPKLSSREETYHVNLDGTLWVRKVSSGHGLGSKGENEIAAKFCSLGE